MLTNWAQKGLKTCVFSPTIAKRSPFGGVRKGTTFPNSGVHDILRMRRVWRRIRCMLRTHQALSGPTQGVMRVRIPISPPASLNRRETAPRFAAKDAEMPVFRKISCAKRTGENGLPGIEWPQSAGLSLEGTCAVRFRDFDGRTQRDHKPMMWRK